MNDWFVRWFGQEYLELYPHRNEDEARHVVALVRDVVEQRLGERPGRILDLACGSGRHSRVLREWDWTAGLDLSPVLLDVAAKKSAGAPYVRGDMRSLPFADDVFGLVVNLFTSYGYFGTDTEHLGVIREIARVTRPGGIFVFDYLNAAHVADTLVTEDEREVNGRMIHQHRHITADGKYVVKTITEKSQGHTYVERVRLFTYDELVAMLNESGMTVVQEFGDYSAGARTVDAPRVILISERQ